MSEQSSAQRATVTTPSEREIHVERVFDAPRERVFAAHTDPRLIPRWYGPRGGTTVVDYMDATTGGTWRFVFRGEDGSEHAFRGVDTATFEDLGERTRIVSTSVFHTLEERDGMLESGMEGGLNQTYSRLDELLAG